MFKCKHVTGSGLGVIRLKGMLQLFQHIQGLCCIIIQVVIRLVSNSRRYKHLIYVTSLFGLSYLHAFTRARAFTEKHGEIHATSIDTETLQPLLLEEHPIVTKVKQNPTRLASSL